MKKVWQALSDDTRREILTLLRKQSMSAGEIAAHFNTTQPTISHHLSILKEAGLCESTSEALRMIKQNAVKIDSQVVTNKDEQVSLGEHIFQVGKRRFAKITLE